MSSELERLLEAYHETLTCPPNEAERRDATFEGLINEVLSRRRGTSREALMEALQVRYRAFRLARRKPTTLPPRA